MKILVCISKTPDTTSKISFTDNNTRFNEDKVQFIVNPYDEWYALVRALEIKENSGGEVVIISAGGADYDPILRKALAIGADKAVRIDTDPSDAYYTAFQIAEYAKKENFELILTGKETIDYNGAQVPGMIAELLAYPFVSIASKLELSNGTLTLERDAPGGIEILECSAPAVVSCAKGMAEQRIPNMRGIMAARTKPLEVLAPVEAPRLTEVVSYSMPSEKGAVKFIDPDNMDELVQLLHNEAKVI